MRTYIGIAAALCLLGVAPAQAKPKEAQTFAAEDLKWTEVPGGEGVMIAVIKGDPAKGAHEAFVKFPAGIEHPLHTHTNEIEMVIISGSLTYASEGGTPKKYAAGSFLRIPGGLKHGSTCDAGAPCVFFQEMSGKFDVKPVAPAAAPKAK